jgi:hypothetical protein
VAVPPDPLSGSDAFSDDLFALIALLENVFVGQSKLSPQ